MGDEAGKPHDHRPAAAGVADDGVELARAEAGHWRQVAARQEARLRELKRRPAVRAALRLEREVEPLWRLLRSRTGWLRSRLAQTAVLLAALPTVPSRRRRRRELALEVGRIEPAALGRDVSVITLEDSTSATRALMTEPTPVVHVLHARSEVSPPDGRAGALSVKQSRAAALDRAASSATTELLCFVPSSVTAPAPGWLAHLAAAVTQDVFAATPTTLHPERAGWHVTEDDLRVRAQGLDVEVDVSGSPALVARGAGRRLDAQHDPEDVLAAPLHCLVVDAAAYRAVGGLDPSLDDDAAAADLCTRLRLAGGRVKHVPSAVVFDDRPVASRAALRWPVDPAGDSWRTLIERHGADVMATAPRPAATAASWVITTAAPSTRVAERWGDWHLAEGMARALRKLGHDVRVQTHDQAEALSTRSRDVHLVLHGLASVRRTPGQRHVIWVISHPETLDVAECEQADLLLVASSRFAASLRSRTSTPVEVFLQATDPDRFRPLPPDPDHAHPVTVVAKTRDVMRRSVADAIAAGVRPAIYGGGWRGLVDASLVVSDHIDNDVLPSVYSSAGVVLNDHWDTMREWGFVSNRIFDVLACGTPVISDDVAEIHDLFGTSVATYRSCQELGDLVSRILADPDGARAAVEAGRSLVLANHTFDHRAQQLVELLAVHPKREAST